jgi:hypothetical protein
LEILEIYARIWQIGTMRATTVFGERYGMMHPPVGCMVLGYNEERYRGLI